MIVMHVDFHHNDYVHLCVLTFQIWNSYFANFVLFYLGLDKLLLDANCALSQRKVKRLKKKKK